MTISEILREKFTEILDNEPEKEELTEEEAELTQTLVFNGTGMFLAFSDVKLCFKSFSMDYRAKKTGLNAAGERT